MTNYVDGYLLPVPKKKLKAYQRLARGAAKVWLDHGALSYREAAADDLKTFCGVPFDKHMKLKKGETAVFAYVEYKSRAHRDKVNAAVMKDPRLAAMCDPKNMPFDPNRMVYGGFKVIVAA
jgi:uncharacterized protein YbaA (DUF1428 family)